MVKFVTVVCDNCHKAFIIEHWWDKSFKMDTGKDECPSCRIIHGEDISKK
jgi:ssDNA-binding Zn-finger/Zn-ribbon topoisomerase 1